jgi:diguanylate cyclase (GGDEF)-like protein
VNRDSESDQAASERDQNASESDQTSSDKDQTASDADQTSSDRDQLQAEADERSADRDQQAADRELGPDPSEGAQLAHRVSQLARERSGLERQATALSRSQIAARRDLQAVQREIEAGRRDAAAADRDRTAESRDTAILKAAHGLGLPPAQRLREAVDAAADLRSHAAADRSRAAKDRERAAVDREESAKDRKELYTALDAAHLDDLTGAFRRGMGEIVLGNELERSQRASAPLTLAVIDADGVKAVNDDRGHAAGDAFLRDLASTIRAKLRPYDPLVRTGGDEFVCTIANSGLDSSRRRFREISTALDAAQPGASISVGLVEMTAEDSLETLMKRGDAALYAAKRKA